MNNGGAEFMATDTMDADVYQTVPMQTDHVIACLREQGFRITKQRKILIDIILNEFCSCCKEVYFLPLKKIRELGLQPSIGQWMPLKKSGH